MSELSDISIELIIPELLILFGIVSLVILPNLGEARFRIPLTSTRVPVFIGGTRFEFSRDPRLPFRISIVILFLSLFFAQLAFWNPENWTGKVGLVLEVDRFSILMSNIFLSVVFLCTLAASHRLPANPSASGPSKRDSEKVEKEKIENLYNNRRQVDFYILILMTAIGMTLMTKSTHLFMLFVCLELASLSSYVLVGFNKETDIGGEAGTKYFIVGSVSSAVGIYGMSLLYLWSGSLYITDLTILWDSMSTLDPLPVISIGMMLVAFGFKIGAAPFHLAIPDAYSGASSLVAGLLATASKAMGFVALMRILVLISMPDQGEAFWMIIVAIISVITMTWGNISALSSTNPKRILAYSSVAHAGYMLAAIAAIGAGLGNLDSYSLIVTAILFHLTVLVVFKLGAFLVLNILEYKNNSHKLEGLHGLASRDPILAGSMFIFLLSLAGVPPFSGFLSKLLMINGILNSTIDTGSISASAIQEWIVSVDMLFWLALAIVLNSALSLFYYLRMGMIMFFEKTENDQPITYSIWIKVSIIILAILTALFGIGPISEILLDSVTNSANDFLGINS
tara:strand:- start:331 stop:2034 length:1704 start_codon:yes stop_codon:yes gene_type:complete